MLVMREVVVGELAAFAILEPLLANLIAANVKVPNFGRHAFEVLLAIDPDSSFIRASLTGRGVTNLLNLALACDRISCAPLLINDGLRLRGLPFSLQACVLRLSVQPELFPYLRQ